jgi:predicted RNA-binding Zn ribbon-like protein
MLGDMAIARWSWLGDQLAIDLANTVRRRGARYIELMTSAADLQDWLEHQRGRLIIPPQVSGELLAGFLALRDHALRVLRAAAGGQPPPAASVAAVNALVLRAPTVRLLSTEPGGQRTEPVTRADSSARLLGDLAAAVIDLLTGPDAETLTLCDAPGCGQLYLRHRPNQQWCGPRCGARARTQRHAEAARSIR